MKNFKGKAIQLLHKKKFNEAVLYFRKHYEISKNKWELYNSLGNVFRAQDDYKKAINYYQKALKLNPRFGLALANLSVALAKNKEYQKAISAAKKALKILPNEMGGIHKNLLPQLRKEILVYKKKLKS